MRNGKDRLGQPESRIIDRGNAKEIRKKRDGAFAQGSRGQPRRHRIHRLSGADGLVELLRRAGYKVTPAN